MLHLRLRTKTWDRFQIHPVVFEIEANGDDGHDNSDPFNHEVVDYTNFDLDEVLDDIDEEGANDDENVNRSSVGNLIRCIVICNDPGAHMSLIDPNATYFVKFSECLDILPTHSLVVYFELEELLMGQKFKTKEECVFAIKWYNMNVLVDYKVMMSKSTLYTGECWRLTEATFYRLNTLMPRMGLKQVNQMESPSVVDSVSYLGLTELIFEIEGMIARGSRHFIIPVCMSWQFVLAP
ncbi:hypothetical protein J1N35_014910 [Gossypium stocksii]|uniref:Uncharacterized protein n=1 Tax=Gossypium stocksii TaxID=47602 RepID=A0A9D3VX95_9ROSI|nr:hypothetical protein J1N35_014910 [Gossypium stocksii]